MLHASALEKAIKKLCSMLGIGQRNREFLGKATASEHPCINVLGMGRRAHEKHSVIRMQTADLRKELFRHLNIVLPEVAVVGGQKPIHLIDEDEGWTLFLRACEYCGHALDRIPDSST